MGWEFYAAFLLLLATLVLFLAPKKAPEIEVVDLIYYPIKSCGGIHMLEAEVGERGFLRDREWAIMKRPDIVVTQKVEARLYKLQPSFEFDKDNQPNIMVLHYFDHQCRIDLSKPSEFQPFSFDFHGASGVAIEVSRKASDWLKEVFREDYFLAHIEGYRNCQQSKPELADRINPSDTVNFQDIFQILVCTEESWEEMLRHLPSYKVSDVSMANMRPNIVVRNAKKAFDEDFWLNFTVGNVKFQGIAECSRCKLVTVSPKTLEHDPNNEPCRTLQRIHGDEYKGYFGLWTQALTPGKVSVKDKLLVSSRRSFSKFHPMAKK